MRCTVKCWYLPFLKRDADRSQLLRLLSSHSQPRTLTYQSASLFRVTHALNSSAGGGTRGCHGRAREPQSQRRRRAKCARGGATRRPFTLFHGVFPRFAAEILALLSVVCGCPCADFCENGVQHWEGESSTGTSGGAVKSPPRSPLQQAGRGVPTACCGSVATRTQQRSMARRTAERRRTLRATSRGGGSSRGHRCTPSQLRRMNYCGGALR